MQTHSHRWPSTWIPSGSSQDLIGSSHSLIWPHYISPNGVTKKTTWSCVQAFNVLSMCKVFLERSKAHFYFDFTAYFHVFPWVLFPSISTPAHSTGGCRGADYIPASLPAGTSPPAGLRHGTVRFLGSTNWISSEKLQQQLHQLLNGLAPPCTGCSIFQLNSQEKAREQIYNKTVLLQSRKKTLTILWFHVHRDSTQEQSQSLLTILSITFLPARFVSKQTETLITFLLMPWNCTPSVWTSPTLFLLVLANIPSFQKKPSIFLSLRIILLQTSCNTRFPRAPVSNENTSIQIFWLLELYNDSLAYCFILVSNLARLPGIYTASRTFLTVKSFLLTIQSCQVWNSRRTDLISYHWIYNI